MERGDRVTFLGADCHADYVRKKGIAFHSIISREEYDHITGNPDIWHPQKGLRTIFTSMQARIGRIAEVVASLPADQALTLICHPLTLPGAGLVRADRPQIRIVGIYLAPANLWSCCDPMTLGNLRIPRWVPLFLRRWMWRLVERYLIDPHIIPALNTARVAKGLAPVAHYFAHMQSLPDLSVTFFPSWYCETRSDWPRPMHRGNFPLYDPSPAGTWSEELSTFLAAADAPIVFTPGTGNRHAKKYFEIALRACVLSGRRAIFLTQYREQIPGDLPATVLWQAYLPLRELLPRVAALVHHGGIGTTAEALRAGVPQLIIPLAFDQFDNAACIERLGVGVSLAVDSLNTARLVKQLDSLLMSERIATQCAAVAAQFVDQNTMDSLCKALAAC